MSESIVGKKSYEFAVGVVKLCQFLVKEKREYVLSRQILRSGTSIGANVSEAISGQSKRDFIHKLSIALKEARETNYWLRILKDTNYITEDSFIKQNSNCTELIKILNSIILTTKEKYKIN